MIRTPGYTLGPTSCYINTTLSQVDHPGVEGGPTVSDFLLEAITEHLLLFTETLRNNVLN